MEAIEPILPMRAALQQAAERRRLRSREPSTLEKYNAHLAKCTKPNCVTCASIRARKRRGRIR